jgi:hypothetical protein
MAKRKSAVEKEPFARIPESVMMSEALMTVPHAAFRVLAILVMGKARERNGTMMCTDSYAEKFGMNSRETVYRSLQLLEYRGLIVRTRQGMRLRKIPTLWAVTWWPIHYRDGQPLDFPRPATHAYLNWRSKPAAEFHTDGRGTVTPIVGVNTPQLHTDFTPESTQVHTDGREYSKSLARAQPTGTLPSSSACGSIGNIDRRRSQA